MKTTYTVWYETETHYCMKSLAYGELTNFKRKAKENGWKIESIEYLENGWVKKTVKFA